ncbi:YiiX/YebB-like N1pC/P60 family cysteine hydrolase [Bacillus sp. B190/17]|uniref:YiiX/YebB-like N1pC/P60 family cysteine hydrolase n=1 Tax=Bacillus lumedeiriae TaxID=3058829 RepID=A0ABW8ID66_9BACI
MMFKKLLIGTFVFFFMFSGFEIQQAHAAKVKGFDFKPGDILVTSSTQGGSGVTGHAGIVLPDGKNIAHIRTKGATATSISISEWINTAYPKTVVVRGNSTTNAKKAAKYALDYWVEGKGKNTSYRITSNPKDQSYVYCSELVWQSYYYGAGFAYKVPAANIFGSKIPEIIHPYNFSTSMPQKLNKFSTVKSFNGGL